MKKDSGQIVEMWDSEYLLTHDGHTSMLLTPDLSDVLKDVSWECSSNESTISAENQISRGPLKILQIGRIGSNNGDFSIAVRTYRRGGLVQKILHESFFCWPVGQSRAGNNVLVRLSKTRAYRELEILSYLTCYGVQVPRPIGIRVTFDRFGFYRAWIATVFISNAVSVLEYARHNEDREAALLPIVSQIKSAVAKMIDLGVYHADFHPGNILVKEDGAILLLDFDKAVLFGSESGAQTKADYAHKLQSRWARAISKYQLSVELVNVLGMTSAHGN